MGKPAPPISLKAGTRLVREWSGVTHMVLIHPDGIEWRGERYRPLSLVARKIAGALAVTCGSEPCADISPRNAPSPRNSRNNWTFAWYRASVLLPLERVKGASGPAPPPVWGFGGDGARHRLPLKKGS